MVVFGDENILLLNELLSPYCDFNSYSGRNLTNEDLIKSNCEILFTRSQTKVNSELLERTAVKLVATATSGADHIDVDYLKSVGINFVSAKGSNANSVAEYVLFSILKWSIINNVDLNESTIGIVGFGCIGKIVSYYSALIGLNVLINDPPLNDSGYLFPEYVQYCDLEELVEKSHILSNHVPLTNEGKFSTYKIFNSNTLSKFSANGLIIHASRGGVIDESVLHGLRDDKNVALVIDVWENEPNFDVNLANKCLIATPHIAGYSYNGKLNGTEIILDTFCKFTSIIIDKSLLNKELNKSIFYNILDFTSRKLLFEQLVNLRKIDEDSYNLKQICSIVEKVKIKNFDKLRKDYPIRYESLSHSF